ncbi:MAG: hypothetical protein CMF50_00780 [Legionellales bacterium]|nr:hypothetical protein [Legionellales bacterium]|tara:strand:+ start:50894 stop:51304 length:411 start_codon:yes stop_codon:yes gene_type:complete
MSLFGDREDIREVFYTVWQKQRNNEPLDAMEIIIWTIIEMHPEYHKVFDDKPDTDFDVNPFMHFGLHIAIVEQIRDDNPTGITALYQQLLQQVDTPHQAEHAIMEVLMLEMTKVMQTMQPFDTQAYMAGVRGLVED